MDHSTSNGTFDPSRRRLCPDGACVGVIRADGRCGECGRTEAEAAAGQAAGGDDREVAQATPDTESGGFDPKRRLCDDGTCVGVVGDDGVCRTCGRRSQ